MQPVEKRIRLSVEVEGTSVCTNPPECSGASGSHHASLVAPSLPTSAAATDLPRQTIAITSDLTPPTKEGFVEGFTAALNQIYQERGPPNLMMVMTNPAAHQQLATNRRLVCVPSGSVLSEGRFVGVQQGLGGMTRGVLGPAAVQTTGLRHCASESTAVRQQQQQLRLLSPGSNCSVPLSAGATASLQMPQLLLQQQVGTYIPCRV